MQKEELERIFKKILLKWSAGVSRDLPWKGENDPYLIWLSEIILQQTRVEQGTPYFLHFKTKYPTIMDLAKAGEDELMKSWQGLGYYTRARNLHATAKYIAFKLGGRFPDTYEAIRRLKGVGPYTAAAIASFAFGLPHAVVDGNVYRVLSRVFGISTPIDTTNGKKEFSKLAQELLDKEKPGKYNQALMDFGALICKPTLPDCPNCPFRSSCHALEKSLIETLPVKAKKLKRKRRYFHFFAVTYDDQLWLKKRTGKDIWKNLYEFPALEVEETIGFSTETLRNEKAWEQFITANNFEIKSISPPFKQTLTHQEIFAVFWEITLSEAPTFIQVDLISTDKKELAKFAFPKIIANYLSNNQFFLNFTYRND